MTMDKKQRFCIWSPNEGYTWTKFAKPALFAHAEEASGRRVYEADIPLDIRQRSNNETAIIVDLPSVTGVEAGLGLAKIGFRPIPLYNGIHEIKNGGLQSAVDNTAIIDALVDGANILRYTDIPANAPPAFLLDAKREAKIPDAEDMYDNRWSVELDDMPDAVYMKEQGISRVIVWTDREMQDDLNLIVNSYLDAGIEIVTYINGKIEHEKRGECSVNMEEKPGISTETKEAVRKFENARFGLLLVVILAAINLVGMFFVNEEPLLWTAPSIMWLTYLWVSEIVGDLIAITLSVAYFVLYLSSHKRRNLMLIALALFAFDALVFYVYAFYYGIVAFTGYSLGYGLVVFSLPVILSTLLITGAVAHKKLEKVSDEEYLTSLDHIDGNLNDGNGSGYVGPRRRVFRSYRGANYRGYGGYGGTGRGGYGGGGYGGFGG